MECALIDAGERKAVNNTLVRTLHGAGIFFVERAFMLIDHDAVGVQRLEAVAVEFFREQPFARTERIGGIDDDQIVFIDTFTHILETVAM